MAWIVLLLVVAAEGFAAAPQLHGHDLGAASVAASAVATSGTPGAPAAGHWVARLRAAHRPGSLERDCPACRLASLARMVVGTRALVAALPQVAAAVPMVPSVCASAAIACPSGRAPPLA